MPDPILMLKAMLAAAIVAAAIVLLALPIVRKAKAELLSVATIAGMAVGFGLGCWLLGVHPKWQPGEVQVRFLYVLMPVVLVVEIIAAFSGKVRWLVWLLRGLVAAAAARIVLHDSALISDKAGSGSREWTPEQTWQILGGLAATLMLVWASVVLLGQRTGSQSVALSLAFPCLGAGAAVMLNGYASGGQIGLPLAGALTGAAIASWAVCGPANLSGPIGLSVVGMFGLLAAGRFFSDLPTSQALLLLLAPLLAWLPELPRINRLKPWLRGSLRVALTAIPVALVLGLAIQKFMADSAKSAPESGGASIDDYMNFGK